MISPASSRIKAIKWSRYSLKSALAIALTVSCSSGNLIAEEALADLIAADTSSMIESSLVLPVGFTPEVVTPSEVDQEDESMAFNDDGGDDSDDESPEATEPEETTEEAEEEKEQPSEDGEKKEEEGDKESELEAMSKRFEALEEKLAEMESSLEDVAEEAGDPTLLHSGSSKSTMKVSGRVHVDAWGFDTQDETAVFDGGDPQNRLGFRRLRFGVKGKVRDNMIYKVEAEFAGGNDSEFRDAYLGWVNLPVLQQVLLGNQKRPYGLDHLNSSRHNVFVERPFVIEGFNQDARRLGLQSYGVSENQAWNWRYGVFNQRNLQGLGNYVDDHLQLEVAGRLAHTIWYDEISGGRGYAHWGVSGSHAESTTNATNEARFRTRPESRSASRWLDTGRVDGADYYDLMGLEGVINVGAFQVVGEYQSVWQGRDAGFDDTRFDGGYVYVSYFLTGEHMPWDRKSGTLGRVKPFQNFWLVDKCDGCRDAGWGAWQVAVRYSQADFSDKDVLGGEGESWTAGLNWLWNQNARMQFNYIAGEVENRDMGTGPEGGQYNIYGARFMIDF